MGARQDGLAGERGWGGGSGRMYHERPPLSSQQLRGRGGAGGPRLGEGMGGEAFLTSEEEGGHGAMGLVPDRV